MMISLKKKNQEGVALVSALSMVVIITIITSVISHKIVTDTKDALHMQKMEAAQNVADEGIETVVDWMNKRNEPTNYQVYGKTSDEVLMGMTAENFISPLINAYKDYSSTYSYQTTQTGVDPYFSYTNSTTSFPPLKGSSFRFAYSNPSSINKIQTYDRDTNTFIGLEAKRVPELESGTQLMVFKSINRNTNALQGDFEVGLDDVSNLAKYDLLKLIVTSYIPSRTAENKTIRRYIATVQRPKDVKIILDHAIIADGSINLGNATADSTDYTEPITLITQQGHVHTNQNLAIGPKGTIDGDASASGTIVNQGTVTGSVTPGAPNKPVPEFDYSMPFPSTVCIPIKTGIPGGFNYKYVGPCTYNGDISVASKDTITIEGSVYVNGNYSESGQSSSRVGSNSTFAMLIVKGDIATSGQAKISGETNRIAFLTTEGSLSAVGNATINGLFVCDNPNGTVKITGNGTVNGGIVSKGTVTFSGSNATVIRDLTINNPPLKKPVDSYRMRIIAWKELKV